MTAVARCSQRLNIGGQMCWQTLVRKTRPGFAERLASQPICQPKVLRHWSSPRVTGARCRRYFQIFKHIEPAITAYLRRVPFYLIVQFDGGAKQWAVKVREEVPVEFSAIIGDVIHNLRAALDLMAVQVVRLNHQSDEDVYFPFSKSAARFDEAIQ